MHCVLFKFLVGILRWLVDSLSFFLHLQFSEAIAKKKIQTLHKKLLPRVSKNSLPWRYILRINSFAEVNLGQKMEFVRYFFVGVLDFSRTVVQIQKIVLRLFSIDSFDKQFLAS